MRMKGCATFLVCFFLAGPVWAQLIPDVVSEIEKTQKEDKPKDTKSNVGEPATPVAPTVRQVVESQFCHTTFFSNEDDAIEFSAAGPSNCFDTGAGADSVTFSPESYPQGVYVYTSTGPSTFVLPPSQVFFYDETSSSQSVISGPSDDILRFGTSRLDLTRQTLTEVETGEGKDTVFLGPGAQLTWPRAQANLDIFAQGDLELDAGCGRVRDETGIDVVVRDASPASQVDVRAHGCGVALKNHAAQTRLVQEGGRTVLETNDAFATFEVTNGASLSAAFIDGDTVLDWSGIGPAAAQISGQGFAQVSVISGETSFVGIDSDGAEIQARAVGYDQTEVVVEGDDVSNVAIEVGGPNVLLHWTPGSSRPFSLSLINDQDVTFIPRLDKEGIEIVSSDGPSSSPDTTAQRDDLGRTPQARQSLEEGIPLSEVSQFPPETKMVALHKATLDAGSVTLMLNAQGACSQMSVTTSRTQRVSCVGPREMEGVKSINFEGEIGVLDLTSVGGATVILE